MKKANVRKYYSIGLVCIAMIIVLIILAIGVGSKETTAQPSSKEPLLLATTTSTENSGLLAAILPDFSEKTGIEVKVIAVGTGKALEMGRQGEVDALLVHAKKSEEKFIEDGHGIARFDVMYNDFVLIGPKEDSAGVSKVASGEIQAALKELSEKKEKFVSRGDDSGTHKKEVALWEALTGVPKGDWYISAGKGMGDTIQMANELLGYTLTDRATFLSMSEKIDLKVVCEKDKSLFNQYGVIAVNPDKNDKINEKAATEFIDWILSEDTGKQIGAFGKEKFGQPLFTPNGKNMR